MVAATGTHHDPPIAAPELPSISTHPMVAATGTPMGVISGQYGLVSVQAEDFLRTFANSIFNSLLVLQL